MNLAQVAAGAAVSAIGALANSGTAVGYSGSLPASPETALSGNTALMTATFNSAAFGAPSYSAGKMTATASLVSASVSPSANGTVAFFRLYESNGTTVVTDLLAAAPWQASTAAVVGQYVTNSSNLYRCTVAGITAASGGPTVGSGTTTDGAATWAFVSAGGADVTLGSTTISVGVTQNVSLTLSMPAV